MTPAFTVAVVTRDRPRYLLEALESVFAQTFTDFEVIVIDNGSDPETRAVLEPYFERITYVAQENRGRAGGRNRALEESEGRWIAYLDDDDTWLPDKLERQASAFASNPTAGLVHGHLDLIDAQGRILADLTAFHRRLWSENHSSQVTYATYALECRCLTSATAMPRAVVEALGGYDSSIGVEDVDLYLRLVREHDVVFLEGPALAQYRHHNSQTGVEQLARGHIELARKHLKFLDTHPHEPDGRRVREHLLIMRAANHHLLLEQRETRTAALGALRLDPKLALRSPRLLRQIVLSFLPHGLIASLRERRSG